MKVRFLTHLAIALFAVVTLRSAQAEIISVGQVFRTGSLSNAFPEFLSNTNATTRAWNLGGGVGNDVTYNGVTLLGTGAFSATPVGDLTIINGNLAGSAGPLWTGAQSTEQREITDSQLVRSPGFNVNLDIAAVEGQLYTVEILVASSTGLGARYNDAVVDGVTFAEDFFNLAEESVVYRFNVTADADGIDLSLGSGNLPNTDDQSAYINAISVTVVPEPSSFVLLALAGSIGLVRRSRSRKC